MRDGQTLVAPEGREESDRDSRLLVISVANQTLCLLNRRRDDQFSAVIALVQTVHSREPKGFPGLARTLITIRTQLRGSRLTRTRQIAPT